VRIACSISASTRRCTNDFMFSPIDVATPQRTVARCRLPTCGLGLGHRVAQVLGRPRTSPGLRGDLHGLAGLRIAAVTRGRTTGLNLPRCGSVTSSPFASAPWTTSATAPRTSVTWRLRVGRMLGHCGDELCLVHGSPAFRVVEKWRRPSARWNRQQRAAEGEVLVSHVDACRGFSRHPTHGLERPGGRDRGGPMRRARTTQGTSLHDRNCRRYARAARVCLLRRRGSASRADA
jgi:hypothetical protein